MMMTPHITINSWERMCGVTLHITIILEKERAG
jgi:hypothetical protein